MIGDAAALIVYACGAFLLLGENRFCYRFLCANRWLAFFFSALIIATVGAGVVITFAFPADRSIPVRLIFGLMILVPCFYGGFAPLTRSRFAPIRITDVSITS